MAFEFEDEVFCHEKDVKFVCDSGGISFLPNNSFLTSSRDLTTKIWTPNENSGAYEEKFCMAGHTEYVYCCAVLSPCEKFPDGCVITGSKDSNILVFDFNSPVAKMTLSRHKGTVCHLNALPDNKFVSSSWDATSILWSDFTPMRTFSGHNGTVWSSSFCDLGVVTCGADKTVRFWCQEESVTAYGHTDCVRDIISIPNNRFLTCGNDGNVCLFEFSKNNAITTQNLHSMFLYSICLVDREMAATSGEDGWVFIFKFSANSIEGCQKFQLPSISIWNVCAVFNQINAGSSSRNLVRNLVCACSDGAVRVFSQNSKRSVQEKRDFEQKVASFFKKGGQKLKLEDCPGPERLDTPGTKAGDQVVIRRGEKMIVFVWSGDKWDEIGEVVDPPPENGNSTATNEENRHTDGKLYDYLIDIELDDRGTKLKLPYNNGDDPYVAAQKFIEENELSPLFLDQIAQFLISNTATPTIEAKAAPQNGGDQAPFSSREFVLFTIIDAERLTQKLNQLNASHEQSGMNIPRDLVQLVISNTLNDIPLTQENCVILKDLLRWSSSEVFPVLDLVRAGCVLNSRSMESFVEANFVSLIENCIKFLVNKDTVVQTKLVSLRLLANLTSLASFRKAFFTQHAYYEKCLKVLKEYCECETNPNRLNAIATLLFNFSVVMVMDKDASFSKTIDSSNLLIQNLELLCHLESYSSEAVVLALRGLSNLLAWRRQAITSLATKSINKLTGSDQPAIVKLAKSLYLEV